MALDCFIVGDGGAEWLRQLPHAVAVATTNGVLADIQSLVPYVATNWWFLLYPDDDLEMTPEALQWLRTFTPAGTEFPCHGLDLASGRAFCLNRDAVDKALDLKLTDLWHFACPMRVRSVQQPTEPLRLPHHFLISRDRRAPDLVFNPDDWPLAQWTDSCVHVLQRGCRFTLQPYQTTTEPPKFVERCNYQPHEQLPVYMLTTGSDFRQENWEQLLRLCSRAKLFRSELNIHGSLRAIAETCPPEFEHFVVVDADNWVTDAEPFSFLPTGTEVFATHCWYATNPVGVDAYGHGGIKIFPKYLFLTADDGSGTDNRIDTTLGTAEWLQVHEHCCSEHRFASTASSLRVTARKEIRKLAQRCRSHRDDSEAFNRLRQWLQAARNFEPLLQAVLDQADD